MVNAIVERIMKPLILAGEQRGEQRGRERGIEQGRKQASQEFLEAERRREPGETLAQALERLRRERQQKG